MPLEQGPLSPIGPPHNDIETRDRSPLPGDRGRSPLPQAARSPSRSPSPPPPSSKIIVENLTKNVKREHIKEIFGVYGTITEIKMALDPVLKLHQGYAYVVYENPENADDAIAHMHEGQLDGQIIDVSIVIPKRGKLSPSPPPLRRGGPSGRRNGPRSPFGGLGRGGRGLSRIRGDSYRPGMNSYRNPRFDEYPGPRGYRDRSFSRSPSPPGRYRRDSPPPRDYRRSSPPRDFRRSPSPRGLPRQSPPYYKASPSPPPLRRLNSYDNSPPRRGRDW